MNWRYQKHFHNFDKTYIFCPSWKYSLIQREVQSVLPAQQITVKWRWIIDNTYLQSTVSGFPSWWPDKKIKCLKTWLPFVTSSNKELQTLCHVPLSPFPERAEDPSLLSPLLRRGLTAILSADSGLKFYAPPSASRSSWSPLLIFCTNSSTALHLIYTNVVHFQKSNRSKRNLSAT